ncbi:MAG: acetyltransferase [Caldilineaceae bacterium]
MNILMIGAGGHAQVIADCLLRMAAAGHDCRPIGFVDDNKALQGQHFLDLPVLGSVAAVATIAPDALIIGIGDNATRQRLFSTLQSQGYIFASAVHPRAIVAPDVTIGAGTLIAAGAVVNTGTSIGANVIVNTAATVDHGNHIGDHAHIAPGVHLGGDVQIGTGALIGIGAIVMPQRTVGDWAVVGAGALVQRTVAKGTTVVGVPAHLYNAHRP